MKYDMWRNSCFLILFCICGGGCINTKSSSQNLGALTTNLVVRRLQSLQTVERRCDAVKNDPIISDELRKKGALLRESKCPDGVFNLGTAEYMELLDSRIEAIELEKRYYEDLIMADRFIPQSTPTTTPPKR